MEDFDEVLLHKDIFIEKTKSMLSLIEREYSECWGNKFPFDEDDSDDNYCLNCGGSTQVEEGGDVVECPSCKGTGVSSERVFDADRFIEFMEHTVMFGKEPFLELLYCGIK